jgi:hypothetical protein
VKKWVIGVVSGIVLIVSIVSTAVVFPSNASNAIYGVLFPSTVTIHNGSESKVIDGTGDNGILNYNNKAYIPLRTFAEAMESRVDYQPPSDYTGVHKIDIYQGIAPIKWSLQRSDLSPLPLCRNPFFIVPVYSEDKYNFRVIVHNQMEEDIAVDSIELSLQVRDKDGNVVYSRSLPPLEGVIPSKFGYEAKVSWDHTGIDGNQISPGEYLIFLARPNAVNYKVLGNDESKSVSITRNMACNLNYYGITI